MNIATEAFECSFVDSGFPQEVSTSVALIIKKCRIPGARVNDAMLHIARTIVRQYPEYICARLAEACVIAAGKGTLAGADKPLIALWEIGLKALYGKELVELPYSASPGNASFLSGATMLAECMVNHADLALATDILEKVIGWDVERATSASSVKAHVSQLLGKLDAIDELKGIAGIKHPMAFYALGLEHLRQDQEKEARAAFENGFNLAPKVASVLLGSLEYMTDNSLISERDARFYVETYCLSEWRASELDELRRYAARHAAKRRVRANA
jgi:hypothetical protein